MKKWYFFIVFLIMIIILPMSISADCAQECASLKNIPSSYQSCVNTCIAGGGNNKKASCSTYGTSTCTSHPECAVINGVCRDKGSSTGGGNSGGNGGGNTGGGNTGGGNTGGGSTGGGTSTGYNGFDCEKCYNESSYTVEDKKSCLVSKGCPKDESRLGNSESNGGSKKSGTIDTIYDSDSTKLKDVTGCESVFGQVVNGKFVDKNSLGYFLQSLFNIVKYVVPIILIVLTVVEFLMAVTSGDKDNITKALKKTYTRLIIVVIIFLVPTILNLLLSFVTENGTCGIR